MPGNQGIFTEGQIRSQNPDLPRPSDEEERLMALFNRKPRRPKPGAEGLQRGHLPPPARRPELLQDRRPRADPDPDPQLLRLHEGAAVGRRGLHRHGDLRRRRRRCARRRPSGSPASTSARSPKVELDDGEGAKVTFTVDEDGLPLHEDATVTIRPRLFLEGNFFLDLRPGSPSAPDLADGGDIPVTQTADRGPARRGPDRAPGARPREPRSALLDGYGVGARRHADARGGRRPGSRRPGRVGGGGDQRLLRLRRRGRQDLLAGLAGPPRRRGRATCAD